MAQSNINAPFKIKRLLVPIDGAELTPRAADSSISLASQLGAEIAGFIVEPPMPLPSAGGNSVEQLRAEESAQRLLRRFEEQARRAGVPFEGHYRHAPDVAEAIVQAAQEYRCDMIVMVTHGRGALGRLVFGSHTQQVLARTSTPVLVMH
jgi:nucleotide-binding universal stress UspA family protein